MASELAVAAVRGAVPAFKAASLPEAGEEAAPHAAQDSPSAGAQAAPGGQSPPPVNPGLHLDLALNVVVLQFYNAQGEVTQSIPSPKQLQAYQLHAQTSSSGSFTIS